MSLMTLMPLMNSNGIGIPFALGKGPDHFQAGPLAVMIYNCIAFCAYLGGNPMTEHFSLPTTEDHHVCRHNDEKLGRRQQAVRLDLDFSYF